MRIKDVSQGRSEIYKIDPAIIEVEENYNARSSLNGIEELAQSIKENGVKIPMSVRIDGDRVLLVRGHRRLAAVRLLIEQGHEIATVPCTAERMGEEDRVLDLILSNEGEKLNPLEQGEVFQRLVNFGWSQTKIAKKTGKTQPQISNYLKLVQAPVVAKRAIMEGIISSSLVLSIVNESKTEKEIVDKIQKAQELSQENKQNGKKKKVTKKAIQEKLPVSKAEIEIALNALDSLDISDKGRETIANHIQTLNRRAQD